MFVVLVMLVVIVAVVVVVGALARRNICVRVVSVVASDTIGVSIT